MFQLIPWRLYAAAAVAITLVTTIGVSRWQVNSLRADIAEARQQSTICAQSLEAQNAAVKSWQAESERRARIAQDALKQASAYRKQAEGRKSSLEAYNPKGKEECDALREIVDLARGFRPLGRVQ